MNRWARTVLVASSIVGLLAVSMQMTFTGLPVPTTETEKHGAKWATNIVIDGTAIAATQKTLIRSGEVWRAEHPYQGDTFGKVFSKSKEPVTACSDVDNYFGCPKTSVDTGVIMYSPHIDFCSFMGTGTGHKTYVVCQMEQPLPATTYLLTIDQDASTGELNVTRSQWMDWSAYEGLWVPCAGSVSPWGSHLGGEEYEPRAEDWELLLPNGTKDDIADYWTATYNNDAIAMGRYWGIQVNSTNWVQEILTKFKPYKYGWSFEVKVDPSDGSYTLKKLFALGRRSHELLYVMPDQKTTYLTDDGTNGHLSMFIADTPGDLSAGSLYCAQFTTVSGDGGGEFTINWVDLGHATEADIQREVNGDPTFSSIFERVAHPCAVCKAGKDNCPVCNQACPAGFTAVNAMWAQAECLKVKTGKEKLASRLESRRYCGMMGGTTETRKMEGFSYDDPAGGGSGKAYIAMSEVTRGMADGYSVDKNRNTYDVGGPNHIKVTTENKCGCVYELTLDGNSQITGMTSLVCGTPVSGDADNTCDVNGLGYPDNVAVVHGHNGLLIGEDGGGHENNVMWFYNFAAKTLTRIFQGVYGAEICSPYFYPDVNGWSYFIGSVQHPYMEYNQDKATASGNTGTDGWLTYLTWAKVGSKSYPVPNVWGQAATLSTDDVNSAPRFRIQLGFIIGLLVLAMC